MTVPPPSPDLASRFRVRANRPHARQVLCLLIRNFNFRTPLISNRSPLGLPPHGPLPLSLCVAPYFHSTSTFSPGIRRTLPPSNHAFFTQSAWPFVSGCFFAFVVSKSPVQNALPPWTRASLTSPGSGLSQVMNPVLFSLSSGTPAVSDRTILSL